MREKKSILQYRLMVGGQGAVARNHVSEQGCIQIIAKLRHAQGAILGGRAYCKVRPRPRGLDIRIYDMCSRPGDSGAHFAPWTWLQVSTRAFAICTPAGSAQHVNSNYKTLGAR